MRKIKLTTEFEKNKRSVEKMKNVRKLFKSRRARSCLRFKNLVALSVKHPSKEKIRKSFKFVFEQQRCPKISESVVILKRVIVERRRRRGVMKIGVNSKLE